MNKYAFCQQPATFLHATLTPTLWPCFLLYLLIQEWKKKQAYQTFSNTVANNYLIVKAYEATSEKYSV